MFAVYGKDANFNDPLASVVVGECPQPLVKEGWGAREGNPRQPEPARPFHPSLRDL